ncbi:hypothetical protein [Fulvimarina sp. MAC3]|uniref:hypothetical protein n=1 Tax=Fulvimarina sp. MAC3 TaxID=3148887 RepID=UPI0031FC14D0
MKERYEKAFEDLEMPLYRMQRLAELIDHMHVEEISKISEDRRGRYYRVCERVGELMSFVAAECREQATIVIDQWTAAHNAECRTEDPS